MGASGVGEGDNSKPQAWSSNQYARWLTVTCWRKRDETRGPWEQYALEAWPACRSTPGAGTARETGFDIISLWYLSRVASNLLLPTFINITCISHHIPDNPLEPKSNNAIYGRLLPGRLPFLQHRQCLPGRDISSTSEPRSRPRLTSGSCHPFDAACNGFS